MDLSACGTLSPADSVAAGPGGPGGTDGPLSSSDWARVLIPAVPAGPVGLDGTMSPSDCVSGVLVDPGGMFPSSDLARMRGPAPPAGSAVLMGPVGPAMSLGVLPLSDSESAEPVMPMRIQYSYVVELLGLLGPVETLLPGEEGPGLCPIVLTAGLLPGVAVPLPPVWDPMIPLSPVEDRRRSSSPCLNLDELPSSDDDTGGSVRLSDLSVAPLCGSDDDHTPVNSDQVLLDVNLPPESVSKLSGYVRYHRMFRLWMFLKSVGLAIPDGQCQGEACVSGCHYPCAFRPRLLVAGILMLSLRDHRAPIRPRWLEQ